MKRQRLSAQQIVGLGGMFAPAGPLGNLRQGGFTSTHLLHPLIEPEFPHRSMYLIPQRPHSPVYAFEVFDSRAWTRLGTLAIPDYGGDAAEMAVICPFVRSHSLRGYQWFRFVNLSTGHAEQAKPVGPLLAACGGM